MEQNPSKNKVQKKANQPNAGTTGARELLDKHGLLKSCDAITGKSIEFTLKQLDDRFGTRMPVDMHKALHAITTCISGLKGKEGPDPTTMMSWTRSFTWFFGYFA